MTDSSTDPSATWQLAPVVILEKVYELLPRLTDIHACSLVCRHWFNVFHCGRQWRQLVIKERTFTRLKFRVPVRRWAEVEGVPSSVSEEDLQPEYEVDHPRLQKFLGKFGDRCQRLVFEPIYCYFNLFEFLRVSEMLLHCNESDVDLSSDSSCRQQCH